MQTDVLERATNRAAPSRVLPTPTAGESVKHGSAREALKNYAAKPVPNTEVGRGTQNQGESIASTASAVSPSSVAMDKSTAAHSEPGYPWSRNSSAMETDLEDVVGVPRGGDLTVDEDDTQLADRKQASSNFTQSTEDSHNDGHPINFGLVLPRIYRSSYPQAQDYPFLKNLGLKTVITLVHKDIPAEYKYFLYENGIRHHVFDMEGTKKQAIPVKTMKAILRLVLNPRNHPLLLHCNQGRHRTGCVVAIVRKLGGWGLSSIIDEYKNYAEPKIRDCDVEYITSFNVVQLSNLSLSQTIWKLRVRRFCHVLAVTFVVLVILLYSWSEMTTRPPST